MPWREVSVMDERREFITLAMQEPANRRELFRRFGISPQTGYKWLGGWAADGELADRSRRPHLSPSRCDSRIEAAVLAVRDKHPAWGARKIVRCLERTGHQAPAASTVHEILRRYGRLDCVEGVGGRAYQRFEKAAPNLLWQMDFKGWVELADGSKCHPLTIVDDHSRYSVCLKACRDQQSITVQAQLESSFRRYGMPDAVFVDNGAPWGGSLGAELDAAWRMAAQAWGLRSAQSAVSPAEPRKERALSPYVEGGSVCIATLPRFCRRATPHRVPRSPRAGRDEIRIPHDRLHGSALVGR